MANCNNIIPISAGCEDNNAGSIKEMYIAAYEDVTVDPTALAAALDLSTPSGELGTGDITMASGQKFEDFSFKKNTSSYTQNWMGDITADVHLWQPVITLGLRRIEVAKRNAIALLAEGRRKLVVIIKDNNDEIVIFGLDDGIRLTASEEGTNSERSAGTYYTITLDGEEKWQGIFIDQVLLDELLVPGV
jgi:hypothetical protein